VDAHRGRDFEGEVIQVRNAPISESNVVHYETIISVDNEERLLKPGMTAEVQIITAEVGDVVRVRNTALRARLPDSLLPADADDYPDADGRVFVLRGGELVTVPVETGLNDDLNTEVRSGVEPGDTLVVGLSLQAGGQEERRSIFGGNQAQY
jgi:HlyD family secretion protein